MNQSLRDKIWAGKYLGPDGALEEARKLFREDSEQHLILYAVTLYSARHVEDTLLEYLKIATRVAACATPAFDARDADMLDIISTHLLWAARRGNSYFLASVDEACALGIELTESEPKGAHTGSLIRTTYADCVGFWHPASCQYLEEAYGRAASITDTNQKVRVYNRLAKAYALRLEFITALECYFEARAMKNAGAGVKKRLRHF